MRIFFGNKIPGRLFLSLLVAPFALICAHGVAQASSTASIWSEIPFVQGADLKELQNTIDQSRDSMRDSLMRQFGELLLPMVEDGADAAEASQALLQAFQSFDGYYQNHKEDALQGIGVSLESIFRADLDELYRQIGLPDSARRMQFVGYTGVNSQARLDFLMFGSFTIVSRGRVTLTLTLENVITGDSRSFEATDRIESAIHELARKVFNFFQSNQYPDWVNPQPQLTWLIPTAAAQPASAASAIWYCRGQGARLPYALELVQAWQGTQYRPGGIPAPVDDQIFPVADRKYYNEQYYYFSGQDQATGGPVRTDAGYGTIDSDFYCVKGDPSQQVLFIESMYRLWRKTTDSDVRKALKYLLAQMSELGANPDNQELFPTNDAAISLLRSKGITLNIPSGLLDGS